MKPSLHTFSHPAMACRFELAIESEDAGYAASVAEAAFQEVDRLEAELSRFRPDSDIGRINARAAMEPVQVGADALACIQMAVQFAAQSCGAFDPTLQGKLDAVRIDATSRRVFIAEPGIALDLGAIGKGYAIDRVGSVLREWSIECALIHAGTSSVLAIHTAQSAEDAGWTVHLRHPRDLDHHLQSLVLRNRALGASGVWRQGAHIVDPRRGERVVRHAAAWVLGSSATQCDAFSTALMVMIPDDISALIESQPGLAAIVADIEDNSLQLKHFGDVTGGF